MERLLDYLNHHPLLVGLAIAIAIAVAVYELRARRFAYASVQPQEAIQLMNQGAQVYDLRDAEAFAAGRIGNAKHLDVGQHALAGESLKKFKDRLLLLYCENGGVSSAVTRQLHAAGFTKVFNLRGGVARWRADGLPLTRG